MNRWLAVLATILGLSGALSCAGGGAGVDGLPRLDAPEPDARAKRVVLISVAGLRPGAYGISTTEGGGRLQAGRAVMPNLTAMATGGAYAEAMEPVLPANPYPVHATLVTGVRPSRHGVLGDELLGPEGLHLRGLGRENRIRGVPLWRAARGAGLSVASLGWPSTGGADIDLLLPDLGVPPHDEKAPWLEQIAREATPWVVDRLGRIDENIAELRWPTATGRDSMIAQLACEIADQSVSPALWLIAFEQTGVALSRSGPDSEDARTAFGQVDDEIGRILDCFRKGDLLDDTAFVVVGDRSFQSIHTLVYPNVALERAGLITRAPVLRGSGIARWRAFVRSHGGSGLVYAESESTALLARRALEEQVEHTRGFRIVSAAELETQHADPQAWFGVQGNTGYAIGKSVTGPLLHESQRRGLAGYLPSHPDSAVGFVAWGAGIRSGARILRTHQLNVAPTVASLLRIELPAADGSPAPGILLE